MPSKTALSGLAIAEMSVGAILIYSGVANQTLGNSVRQLLTGTYTTGAVSALGTGTGPDTDTEAGTADTGAASAVSASSAQAALQQTAAEFGWGSGSEWQALSNVEMAEAGFNPNATNASSGAFGLAQALGHGTSGTACPSTGVNEYGGYGLSTAQAQQANCGNAADQALWMCNYIKETYGTPSAAWAHEQEYHWY